MIYRLRVILDVEEDVLRDLEIAATASLKTSTMPLPRHLVLAAMKWLASTVLPQNGNKEKSFPW